jgi:hypothetical protein
VTALALASGLGGVALATAPAQAGDTGRDYGCAAHWRHTAAWNECKDSPGTNVQLQVHCKNLPSNDPDYYGPWRYVRGSLDYVDRHECRHQVLGATNAYRP